MDKPVESKRAVNSNDLKPVERFLKRYDTLVSKDFSSRRPDAREQIIEEQIEEYKKKREKIFGNQSVVNVGANETHAEETHVKKTEEETRQEDSEEKEKEEEIDIDIKTLEETQEKAYDNTEEYLSRLSKLKQKWEEAKRKKESQQKELDESSAEGNLEKLARVLGDKEENLQVFETVKL